MRSFLSALPALLTAVLFAVAPGCVAVRPEAPPAVQHPHVPPVERPVQPREPCDISGIERGAGEWHPFPAPNADDWVALVVYGTYLFYLIGYSIAWCFVSLAELIDDAFESPCDEDCKEEQAASSP